eukprot:2306457-Alexandrium_andersonii.AAC.1
MADSSLWPADTGGRDRAGITGRGRGGASTGLAASTAAGLATGVVPSTAGVAGPDAAALRASSSAISLLRPPF